MLQKVQQLQPVRSGTVVKVQSVGLGLDADGVSLHAVLQDELLEEEERALVLHLLSHLHARGPLIGVCGCPGARVAHAPLHHVLHHECLLQDGAVQYLLLDRELDLQSLAVGLRPYEPGVHELDLTQALDSLDAEREEFFGLEVGADPVPRRLQVPRALVAVPHRALLLDTVRDVNLRSCGCGRAAVRGEEGGSGRGGSGWENAAAAGR